MNSYSSKLVETAVNEFSRLPGIGRKTALRLALHLLKQETPIAEALGNAIISMRKNIMFCKECFNISDSEICEICANPKRDKETVCVVEDIRDVMAIENTGQYNGVYHILGGIISPMDGIGPDDLNIDSLINRVSASEIKEVIMALSTTIEGDTTNFYIFKKLKDLNVKVTTIARGIAIGDELEYADEITLGRSILNRMPYESTLES
ncbi:MAG: recombination mediator RecR [Bacteroidales bacterium]|nr:recombination mediator RecR [Bacteroidales bacterium]